MNNTELCNKAAAEWDHAAMLESHDEVGRNRAQMYRATAKSLRMEAETGIAVCPCCFKPYPKGGRY